MTPQNKIWRKITKWKFRFILHRKWNHDCHFLPMTPAHKELYELIHCRYWKTFGKFPNLVDCQDLNERVQWLKLFDQDREIVRCINKITVRNYVQEQIGNQYLVKLYQVHNHFDQINFDGLPNAFVIKANNDSGTVFLVQNKDQLDKPKLRLQIEAALQKPFSWKGGEWAYSYILPKVLVEELINPQENEPPADYKFYCSGGVVKFLSYIYYRGGRKKGQIINPDGSSSKIQLVPNLERGADFKKPEQWDELIKIAERLSKKFKFVRVDLFLSTEGRIYVGELTFWPLSGYYQGEGQKILGSLLDFDRTTFKPPILPELEIECSRASLYPLAAKQKRNPEKK